MSNKFEDAMKWGSFATQLASKIMECWAQTGDVSSIMDKKISEIPGIEEIGKRFFEPNMSKFLEEYRKRKPK